MDFMLFNEFLQYSNPVLIMKSTNYSNLNEECFLNDPHSSIKRVNTTAKNNFMNIILAKLQESA